MSLRTRAIVFGASAAFLLLCALLPLAFKSNRTPEEPGGELLDNHVPASPGVSAVQTWQPEDFNRRAEIFSRFKREGAGGGMKQIVLEPVDLTGDELAPVAQTLSNLFTAFGVDPGPYPVDSEGCIYYSLTDSDGASIRVAERFIGWNGDWTSWFIASVDIDTRDIYYIYTSNSLTPELFEEMSFADRPEDIMGAFSEALGYDIVSFDYVEDARNPGMDNMTATFRSGEMLYEYEISGFTRSDVENGQPVLWWVDYKMVCLSGTRLGNINNLEENPGGYDS